MAEQKVAAVDHPAISPLDGELGMPLDFRVHGVRQIVVFVFPRWEIGKNHTNPDVWMPIPKLLQAGVHRTVKLPLVANIKCIHTLADQILDCIYNQIPNRPVGDLIINASSRARVDTLSLFNKAYS